MENYTEINYENNMKILSQALKYCEQNFVHNDIINELYSSNDLKKQICIIELNTINNQSEADILAFNLTNHSGPIREVTSFKILELIKNYKNFFQSEKIINIFIKAISDINPSVSRNTVEIIKYVDNIEYLYKNISEEIKLTLDSIISTSKNHSYVRNKKNFKLYWNLEAIISISDKLINDNDLFNILMITSDSNDYTIREKSAKTAKILSQKNPKFKQILFKLQNDENIYVRKYTN